jgi:hypothetical protein
MQPPTVPLQHSINAQAASGRGLSSHFTHQTPTLPARCFSAFAPALPAGLPAAQHVLIVPRCQLLYTAFPHLLRAAQLASPPLSCFKAGQRAHVRPLRPC